MNKTELLQQVITRLENDLLQAQQAAQTAYETAMLWLNDSGHPDRALSFAQQ